MTSSEEPYVLTREEEEDVWNNAVESLRLHKVWKMAQMGMQEGAILQKLAEMDLAKEIDYETLLIRANANKRHQQWQQARRMAEREEEAKKAEECKAYWTAKQMLHLMKFTSVQIYNRQLLINDDTLPLIKTLCFFLSRDKRFESELNYSFSKGLLIRGISGLGKTHLVTCVKDNELNPVLVLNMIEITDTIKGVGEFTVPSGAHKILYLDDVGTEETPVNFYGTKINWFKDFVELYYTKKLPFNSLMLSTNNSFQQMEDKYGFRVRSRLKDMFNIIDVTGKDLRGTV